MRWLKTFLVALAAGGVARADVAPNPLFSDNMVLQRGAALPVWGKADPGEPIEVRLERKATGEASAAAASTTAGPDGKWKVTLPQQKAGEGYTLTIKGKNTIGLKNVAVGDVWICSGQSNMQWSLAQLTREDQGKKVAEKAANPNLRLFAVQRRPMPEPQETVPVTKTEGQWLVCTPETVINFSAVAYFFGRDIQKDQNVPVGLISTNVGGTPAEAWTSKEGLLKEPDLVYYVERTEAAKKAYDPAKVKANYEAALAKWEKDAAAAKAKKQQPPRRPTMVGPGGLTSGSPTGLYNAMIAPLQPFAIKGAIWYQGESNAGRAAEYRKLMPALIQDWRTKWGSEFPFFMVQLAPFRGGASGVDYAELRDAQLHTTKILPKVGIAIITDVGEETDIHPQRKEPVGQRLALAARAIAYGQQVESRGPEFKSLKIEGDKAVLAFDHINGGLVCKGDALAGFQIAGEDKVFHPAKAEIKGESVVVTSEKVSKPWAVRYGWVNFAKPELNFFNKSGLPAVPFRTDDLPLTTAPQPMKKAS